MATLELDINDANVEVLTLRFPAGTVVATIGSADYVQAQLDQQVKDIRRRQILQKYANLSTEELMIADAAAQAELAKQ